MAISLGHLTSLQHPECKQPEPRKSRIISSNFKSRFQGTLAVRVAPSSQPNDHLLRYSPSPRTGHRVNRSLLEALRVCSSRSRDPRVRRAKQGRATSVPTRSHSSLLRASDSWAFFPPYGTDSHLFPKEKRGPASARACLLLSNAEAAEDPIEQIVRIHRADHLADLIERPTQFQSEQLRRITVQHDGVCAP
jgi:hypothetical protein